MRRPGGRRRRRRGAGAHQGRAAVRAARRAAGDRGRDRRRRPGARRGEHGQGRRLAGRGLPPALQGRRLAGHRRRVSRSSPASRRTASRSSTSPTRCTRRAPTCGARSASGQRPRPRSWPPGDHHTDAPRPRGDRGSAGAGGRRRGHGQLRRTTRVVAAPRPGRGARGDGLVRALAARPGVVPARVHPGAGLGLRRRPHVRRRGAGVRRPRRARPRGRPPRATRSSSTRSAPCRGPSTPPTRRPGTRS